jgi:stalled ribosome rescue protein Dom34
LGDVPVGGTNIASKFCMTPLHAVLWIDQHEAKIFHFDDETFDVATIESAHRHVRRHPRVTAERTHPADAQHYYRDVARTLDDAREILVVGPATAKLEFIKYVHKHDHALEPKIVGVETVDHPTDGQIVAYARRYFRAADRMR